MPIVNDPSNITKCSSSQRSLGSCLNWKRTGMCLRHKHPCYRGTSLWQITSAAVNCSYKLHFTLPSITPAQLTPWVYLEVWSISYCQLAFFSQKITQAWSPKFRFKALTGTLAHTHLGYKKSIAKLFQICSHSCYYSTVLAFQLCIVLNWSPSVTLILL